ncbi:hypothetical protein PFBG_01337 [Plasmodium falciparum 7G8]|uniref:Zinc transporter ZIP1 n=4 Tax=Plasmodium falciparum TaxID=5833 RepID=ZIP1_PLAF7|nr:zinc transporter ZIP1, putative [Plasmodium falciparum 3D7]EUR75596.1 hypothetical protein PFBG_01337 [Plasmodium falciparum 7G8]KAF4327507.1 zinc transporter ZIP1 [Plasmodium falciparum NF54]PKC43062.1 zinc transporter ZIP1 [Plasmodium falciparum NF54]CAG25333.2 zinc transporter ZIP1, putative [Plasmodium falciparum 3D7]|eukprot:XP_024328935.1 Zn2+ or Fe2+ permease [Plasmodium falciparum 3D7]
MDLLFAKIICIGIFLVVTTFGCFIPHLMGLYKEKENEEKNKRVKNILSNLNCFGSGFIFSIIMFHLLPETIHIISDHGNIRIFNTSDSQMKILYIFFFVFIGFCMQLGLEYVLPVDTNICCVSNLDSKKKLEDTLSQHITKNASTTVNIEMQNIDNIDHIHEHSCEGVHTHDEKSIGKFLEILTLQSFFLTISLAIHSCIEGMIIGTSTDVNYVFISSFCILLHKWIAGVTVSLSLNSNNMNKTLKAILLLTFVFASPLGIVLGHMAKSAGQKVTCLINAVSIGTLLFIGCEILLNEIKQNISRKVRLCKWLSFCFSCLIAFALISFTTSMAPHTHGDIDTHVHVHHHDHDHDHGHNH